MLKHLEQTQRAFIDSISGLSGASEKATARMARTTSCLMIDIVNPFCFVRRCSAFLEPRNALTLLVNVLIIQYSMMAPSNGAFRALADQTRREILRMLRSGPRTSGEIASRFDSSWPTISRHLAVLREAGLVIAERNGQEIYYELNTSVFQDLVQYLIEWGKPATGGRRRNLRRVTKEQGA